MKWFEGGIPIAIQTARQNNSVFIVYIAGEDALSEEMESRLHDPEVTSICEENQCVAVRIMGDSNDCKFFSQIYCDVAIPSIFLIGNSGTPLEIIDGSMTQQQFLDKVRNAIELQKNSTLQGASAQSPLPSQGESAATSEQLKSTEAVGVSKTRDEGAVASGNGDEPMPERNATVDDDLVNKVERAKQLVEMKKDEKREKEVEEEKSRELERRTTGQGVQKLRDQQKETDLMDAKKELLKDREQDKQARQRVKEQIARDRVEKAERFGKEKDGRDQAREEARKKKNLEEQAAQQEEQARRSDTARLQFRRPDGTSITQQFPATATFAEVHDFITQEMGLPVTLSTTFPRRTFTQEDHTMTLQQLQLAPSAAVLVIPTSMSTSRVRGNSSALSLTSMAGYILAPVLFVWNMIASILGLSGTGSTSSSALSSNTLNSSRPQARPTGGDRDRGSAVNRSTSGASSRQEGAIRRFHNTQDDEHPDDSNTWNGNSTQQM